MAPVYPWVSSYPEKTKLFALFDITAISYSLTPPNLGYPLLHTTRFLLLADMPVKLPIEKSTKAERPMKLYHTFPAVLHFVLTM